MRKLIMWNMVTLDGFFAGPNGELDWFVFDDDLGEYIDEVHETADTYLFGRVTYEGMASYWPTAEGKIADFMNSVPKVVFSKTLSKAEWNNTRLIRDNVPAEIGKLRQQPGKNIFVVGSADFSATLMRDGLVDEYRFAINPVMLGKGIPFFKGGGERLNLKLIETRPLKSGVVILHYLCERA